MYYEEEWHNNNNHFEAASVLWTRSHESSVSAHLERVKVAFDKVINNARKLCCNEEVAGFLKAWDDLSNSVTKLRIMFLGKGN